jgi:FkbM family methyltransferase
MLLARANDRIARARLSRAGVLPSVVEVDLGQLGIPGTSFVLATGLPVDQVARHVWLEGPASYEAPWPILVASLSDKIRRAIVVGANSGFYAMLIAHADPVERVDALEPFPPAFRRLTENVAASSVAGQVFLHLLAASAEPGQMTLYIPQPLSNGWPLETSASLDPSFKAEHSAQHAVTVTTVDLIADQSPIPVGLLFIDAEGFDLEVLAGAESTICRDGPFVIVEASETDVPGLNAFLSAHDYLAFEVSGTAMWLRNPVVHAVVSSPIIGSRTRQRYWSNLLAPAASLETVRTVARGAGLDFYE